MGYMSFTQIMKRISLTSRFVVGSEISSSASPFTIRQSNTNYSSFFRIDLTRVPKSSDPSNPNISGERYLQFFKDSTCHQAYHIELYYPYASGNNLNYKLLYHFLAHENKYCFYEHPINNDLTFYISSPYFYFNTQEGTQSIWNLRSNYSRLELELRNNLNDSRFLLYMPQGKIALEPNYAELCYDATSLRIERDLFYYDFNTTYRTFSVSYIDSIKQFVINQTIPLDEGYTIKHDIGTFRCFYDPSSVSIYSLNTTTRNVIKTELLQKWFSATPVYIGTITGDVPPQVSSSPLLYVRRWNTTSLTTSTNTVYIESCAPSAFTSTNWCAVRLFLHSLKSGSDTYGFYVDGVAGSSTDTVNRLAHFTAGFNFYWSAARIKQLIGLYITYFGNPSIKPSAIYGIYMEDLRNIGTTVYNRLVGKTFVIGGIQIEDGDSSIWGGGWSYATAAQGIGGGYLQDGYQHRQGFVWCFNNTTIPDRPGAVVLVPHNATTEAFYLYVMPDNGLRIYQSNPYPLGGTGKELTSITGRLVNGMEWLGNGSDGTLYVQANETVTITGDKCYTHVFVDVGGMIILKGRLFVTGYVQCNGTIRCIGHNGEDASGNTPGSGGVTDLMVSIYPFQLGYYGTRGGYYEDYEDNDPSEYIPPPIPPTVPNSIGSGYVTPPYYPPKLLLDFYALRHYFSNSATYNGSSGGIGGAGAFVSPSTCYAGGGGGGAGGIIFIAAQTLRGTGTITVKGGDGGYGAGTAKRGDGGAGGVIILMVQHNEFQGTLNVNGGTGNVNGPSGIVYIIPLS